MALFQNSTPGVELERYSPDLKLQSLVPGVDNFRHDVRLSPKLTSFCGPFIFSLIIKHSGAGRFLDQTPTVGSSANDPRAEFKRLVREVLVTALSQARAQRNPELDLLANLALFKYLAWEMQQQYGNILLQGKSKMKLYESPKHVSDPKAASLAQAFSDFQTLKKHMLRAVGQELQRTVNEIQADAVRKTRESFFGQDAESWFAYFSNPLLFTDNGRDDYIHMDRYVMAGNYQHDPDYFDSVEKWLRGILRAVDASPEARELAAHDERKKSLAERVSGSTGRFGAFGKMLGGAAPAAKDNTVDVQRQVAAAEEQTRVLAGAYEQALSGMLNVADNMARITNQKPLQDEMYRSAEKAGLLPFMMAAYETAKIYPNFCPPINPQNLKQALIKPDEREKVAELIRHYKMPGLNTLQEAAGKVRTATAGELRQAMIRFVTDYCRHHRDAQHLSATQTLQDRIHLMLDDRNLELSRINGTLYEFLISSEEQPAERKVTGHVILKADIRDSTRLTSELMARGLNPASYFSLNFYEPLNRLRSKYGAEKVFIEGDAVILALFEHEGARGNTARAVALACGLAREMIEMVKLYNTKSDVAGLPQLEIGIGITFRDTAPLYLLDGENRIMISEALNLSDRLSGCHKLARKTLSTANGGAFNVFVFQTISEDAAAGTMEEFLVRYNVNGVCLSQEAFEKLRSEISLSRVEGDFPMPGGKERVTLYSGAVPISADVYQRLVVREAVVPFVEPHTFALKEKTTRRYFELCTSRTVYDFTDKAVSGVFDPRSISSQTSR